MWHSTQIHSSVCRTIAQVEWKQRLLEGVPIIASCKVSWESGEAWDWWPRVWELSCKNWHKLTYENRHELHPVHEPWLVWMRLPWTAHILIFSLWRFMWLMGVVEPTNWFTRQKGLDFSSGSIDLVRELRTHLNTFWAHLGVVLPQQLNGSQKPLKGDVLQNCVCKLHCITWRTGLLSGKIWAGLWFMRTLEAVSPVRAHPCFTAPGYGSCRACRNLWAAEGPQSFTPRGRRQL